MFKLGKQSQDNLKDAHRDLRRVMMKAISISPIDFTVIESFRNEYRQNKYFQDGKSKVIFPDGKHNKIPSDAVDVAPWVNGKISWHEGHCLVMAGAILAAAAELDIEIRWGGNWDRDGEPLTDQDFQDLVHFERVG